MSGGGRRWSDCGLLIGVAGLVLGIPRACPAEEIAPFRLTSVEGHVEVRYLTDTQVQGFSDSGTSSYAISDLQEELFVNTHSYFYHPNFLKMDLGAGPMWVQSGIEQDGASFSDRNDLYNLTGRLSFFDPMSVPIAVYYDHLNPTVTTSLTQSFVQTNTRYGGTFTVREPLSPVLVTADAYRLRSEGRSVDWIVNDTTEQASLRLSSALGTDGYAQLLYQVNHQDSLSGNPALPIVPAAIESRTASLDTPLRFGANRQGTLTNLLSYNTLTYVRPDYTLAHRDLHFTPDLRWQHSEVLTSFYNYNLYDSSENSIDTTNQSARAGLIWRDADRWSATVDVHGEDDRTTGLSLRSYGTLLQGNYTRPFTNAVLRLSAGAVYDQNDRQADSELATVVGEQVVLVDGIPVTLTQFFIDTTTIRVFNLDRTQEYTLADYRIIVIGSQTQIQRLATGAILDGQAVLVDYQFQTGGTTGFNVFDESYQASLTLYRYYTAYVRYHDTNYHVTSGVPTLPFNSQHNTLFGVRVDQPLRRGYTVGGEAMFENQDEVIAPYQRESLDTYLQTPMVYRVSLRLSTRRVRQDYADSPEDVDLTGWGLQLRSIPWAFTLLTAEATYEDDVGGTLPRALWRDTVGIEWRVRQLSLRADGEYSREKQGSYNRERTVIRVTARREF
jgi:hypothetical protein